MPVTEGMRTETAITATSEALFLAYAKDADNWNGCPLVGGNVGGSKEERGNLTQLKRAGLIKTQTEEGNTWIYFTRAGLEFAANRGVSICGIPARLVSETALLVYLTPKAGGGCKHEGGLDEVLIGSQRALQCGACDAVLDAE